MSTRNQSVLIEGAKVFFDAARETPKQMFAPWVAFLGAAKDIATGQPPRTSTTATTTTETTAAKKQGTPQP